MDTNVNKTIQLPFEYRQSYNSLACGYFTALVPLAQHTNGTDILSRPIFQTATIQKWRISNLFPFQET